MLQLIKYFLARRDEAANERFQHQSGSSRRNYLQGKTDAYTQAAETLKAYCIKNNIPLTETIPEP
jgi:hypothetical protein